MKKVDFNSFGAFVFENKLNVFDSLKLISDLQQNHYVLENKALTEEEINEFVELNTLTDDELKGFTNV